MNCQFKFLTRDCSAPAYAQVIGGRGRYENADVLCLDHARECVADQAFGAMTILTPSAREAIADAQDRQVSDYAPGYSFDRKNGPRRTVTGRVYQQPATGAPYTVIVVDGAEVRVNLVRANPALPVEIPPESRGVGDDCAKCQHPAHLGGACSVLVAAGQWGAGGMDMRPCTCSGVS